MGLPSLAEPSLDTGEAVLAGGGGLSGLVNVVANPPRHRGHGGFGGSPDGFSHALDADGWRVRTRHRALRPAAAGGTERPAAVVFWLRGGERHRLDIWVLRAYPQNSWPGSHARLPAAWEPPLLTFRIGT
jgi:hypothetical protein